MNEPVELKMNEWNEVNEDFNRGLDMQVILRRTLAKMYPGFEFGSFSEDEIDKRLSANWRVFTLGNWLAKAEWNNHVAGRYGLKEKDGALVFRENFICVRPIHIGDKDRKKLIEISEETYQRARGSQPQNIKKAMASRGDVPVGQSISETFTSNEPSDPIAYRESDADEGEHVYDDTVEKPRRGRPPKPRGE